MYKMIKKFEYPAGKLKYSGESGKLKYKRNGTGQILVSVNNSDWRPIPDSAGNAHYWKLNGKLNGLDPYEEAKKQGIQLNASDSAYIAGPLRYGLNQTTFSTPEERDAYRRIKLEDLLSGKHAKGGSIKIKKKNKGKFTESAKRAGKSVQEHARDVVNDPKATKLQNRRAQFALNSKKFKHQNGGRINYLKLF